MPSIPENILVAQSAGRIPDNVTLKYLAESRDQVAVVAIAAICTVVVFIVSLRCYARVVLLKQFGLDDILAVVTLPFYIVVVVLSIVLIKLGSGRHIEYIQYVLDLDTVKKTEVFDFVSHILYTTALFVCRASGLAFYFRLASHHRRLRVLIIGTGIFLACSYIPQFFLLLFHCRPVTGLWPYAWQPDVDKFVCLQWGVVYSTNAAISLVCDVAMLAIPIVIIYLLQLDRRRKMILSFILLPGILVLVISSVRLYLVVKGQWAADGSWYYNPMLILETSEVGGTLLALSVPALKPLLGSWATTIIGPLSAGPAASGQTGKTTPYGSNARRRSWMRSSKPRSDVMTPTGVPYDYELSSKNAANGTGTEVSPSKYSDEALLNQPGLSTYDDRDETVRSNGQPVQAITVIKEFSTH